MSLQDATQPLQDASQPALSAASLLNLWEAGRGRTPVEQALLLLSAAFPKRAPDELAQLTIGQRDALLLRLREQTFGPRLTGLSVCPKCGERLETTFMTDEILESLPTPAEGGTPLTLETQGFKISFRLPTSLDLQNAPDREALLAVCVLAATQEETATTPASLPEAVTQSIVARMEQADPLASVSMPFTCPACGHAWQPLFDINSFFWSEINAWAFRMLREVHLLASAYGWSEAEILALSAWRRQCYLEMVSA